jgi:hypothetical protein
MARISHKKLQILKRRQQVAELYLQCWAQAAIAEHLGVDQSTVSGDLRALRREWRDSALRDFNQAQAEELQRIDRVEREAWAAWELSKKPAQSAVVNGDAGSQRKTIKNRHGDPRMLELALKCVAQRRALLALDNQPAELNPHANLTLDARRDRLFAIFTQLRQRAGDGGTGTDAAPLVSGDVRLVDEPG